MVRTVLRASSRVYVSIPRWIEMLRRYEPGRRRPVDWLPIPSTVPTVEDFEGSAAVRRKVAPGGQAIVGSFGTFHGLIADLLTAALPRLITRNRVGLLIGRGSEAFAARLIASHPGLEGRLVATGGLTPREVAVHLGACDLLAQLYPDGVSSRRTTVMAALANGRPVVSTSGPSTEPIWAESKGVALTPTGDVDALARAVDEWLADPAGRERLGSTGRALYLRRFAMERTIEALTRPGNAEAEPALASPHAEPRHA